MINHFKAIVVIDGKELELSRTFYTYKQAEDYCTELKKFQKGIISHKIEEVKDDQEL